jgi:hypothetical protein
MHDWAFWLSGSVALGYMIYRCFICIEIYKSTVIF